MDTKTLITEAKARFNHNAAKAQLKDKYDGKLIIASQGGLWKADQQTINFLSNFDTETLILVDTFNSPITVDRVILLDKLKALYNDVMQAWYNDYKEIENIR
jgi:hypothetical protein